MTQQPFIVLEGIDGAGKSTQAKMLVERLESYGYTVCSTFEPSKLSVGAWLRGQLHSGAVGLDELARCYLFAADRAQHLDQVIRPALECGEVVVCDRYMLSTFAYQRSDPGNQISLERLMEIHQFEPPDLTILLKIDPKVSLYRMSDRDNASVYEEKKKLGRIAKNYAELAQNPKLAFHNIVEIEACDRREETFEKIWTVVLRYLLGTGPELPACR